MNARLVALFILILLLLISTSIWWQKNHNKDTSMETDTAPQSEILTFMETDLQQGWYYGQQKDKRPGTPPTWQHQLEGTRGARWYDPNR